MDTCCGRIDSSAPHATSGSLLVVVLLVLLLLFGVRWPTTRAIEEEEIFKATTCWLAGRPLSRPLVAPGRLPMARLIPEAAEQIHQARQLAIKFLLDGF